MAAYGKPKPKPKPPGATPAAPPPPPPPPPPVPEAAKKGFLRRMVPFLLAANLFVGVYMLVRTYNKDSGKKDAETGPAATAAMSNASAANVEKSVAVAPSKVFPPIPEDEQRQLYKWVLEEKRKVRPRNAAEKKKLDDEKALLKEFIRAESLPRL